MKLRFFLGCSVEISQGDCLSHIYARALYHYWLKTVEPAALTVRVWALSLDALPHRQRKLLKKSRVQCSSSCQKKTTLIHASCWTRDQIGRDTLKQIPFLPIWHFTCHRPLGGSWSFRKEQNVKRRMPENVMLKIPSIINILSFKSLSFGRYEIKIELSAQTNASQRAVVSLDFRTRQVLICSQQLS